MVLQLSHHHQPIPEKLFNQKVNHICYDNQYGNEFVIEKLNVTIWFFQTSAGLYLQYASNNYTVVVTMVEGNCEVFTNCQYEHAKASHQDI